LAKKQWDPSILKIAILPESPEYHARAYIYIAQNHTDFHHIFTCDKELLSIDPARFHYTSITDCWIPRWDEPVYIEENALNKTANISAIFSDKNALSGHKVRHLLYQKYRHNPAVDFYGTITGKRLKHKCDALFPYRFSLAIENCRKDFYFTEKLIDCLATYTLPIFWGATEFIEKHFNPEGFLTFTSMEDIGEVLKIATPDYYEDKLPSITENYNLLKNFPFQRAHLEKELSKLLQQTT